MEAKVVSTKLHPRCNSPEIKARTYLQRLLPTRVEFWDAESADAIALLQNQLGQHC